MTPRVQSAPLTQAQPLTPPQIQFVHPPVQEAPPPQIHFIHPSAQEAPPPQIHFIHPPAQEAPPPQIHFIHPTPPSAVSQPTWPEQAPPVVSDVQIMPRLPDPADGKVYRLQVGSFSSPEAAARIVEQMRAVGFNAFQEQSPPFYRVIASDVPSAMVFYAAQRLGATLGVRQIWVRD